MTTLPDGKVAQVRDCPLLRALGGPREYEDVSALADHGRLINSGGSMKLHLKVVAVLATLMASVPLSAMAAPVPTVSSVHHSVHGLARSEYLPAADPLSALNSYISVTPTGYALSAPPAAILASVPAGTLNAWKVYVKKADARIQSGQLVMNADSSASYSSALVPRAAQDVLRIHWYGVTVQSSPEVPPVAADRSATSAGTVTPLDNTHCLTPRQCYSAIMVRKESAATSHCLKVATSAAAVGAGATAVVTTPIDVPGITLVATFTWLGAAGFCSIGWW